MFSSDDQMYMTLRYVIYSLLIMWQQQCRCLGILRVCIVVRFRSLCAWWCVQNHIRFPLLVVFWRDMFGYIPNASSHLTSSPMSNLLYSQ
jgi:hypothetical protein